MANIIYPLLIAVVFLAALPHTTAQSPTFAPTPLFPVAAPSPALDCFPYLLNLSDCLSFVLSDSNLTQPDPACCPELSNLVNIQPICLCQLLGNSGAVGVSVNMSRALNLPTVCNVSTPSVSLCAEIGYPVSPSEAPSPTSVAGYPVSSPMPSEAAPSPSSGGSDGGSAAASPSPGTQNDNGSRSNIASKRHFFVGLAAALFMYFF